MQNQEKKQSKREYRSAMALIALCWLVYSSSYIGRINYNANIIRIQDYFSIDNNSEMGIVTTMFFFAYGIGQVVNGIWCKKYNLKWIVFTSLMVSGVINLVIPFLPVITPIKYLWCVNGFLLSVLWPSLIRLLAEVLPKKYMGKSSLIMGTSAAVGTFFVYGTSALYALFTDFKAAFLTAAIMLIAVAVLWISSVSNLVSAQQSERVETIDAPTASENNAPTPKRRTRGIMLTVCMLAFFGIFTNLIKDGLGTWVPSILKENYGIQDSLSIILTLALPIVAILGNALAVMLYEKLRDFVYDCALCFSLSAIFIVIVINSFSLDGWWLLLLCFTVVTLLVSACNSIITSVFPLFMKGKVNSGLIAGVLNGFCYVGSTLSTYGLAMIADKSGWMAVFETLLYACVAVMVAGVVYFVIKKLVLRADSFDKKDEKKI